MLTRRLHLGKGQLVDLEGRLQTRQWDDDAGKRYGKTEVVASPAVPPVATLAATEANGRSRRMMSMG
ncbi:MAG TPA: single-stranded DNA-binding protein [Thermoleophilaceae bacterium]|nr:single-stranded DNA-binding protein [Thermoleophilaceae bacterium]